jgi:hypothetical protein
MEAYTHAGGDGQGADGPVTPDNLIERATASVSIVYQPEVIAMMAKLALTDLALYVHLLNRLASINGFRLTEFKNAVRREQSRSGDENQDAIALLMQIVSPCSRFYADGKTAFVDFNVEDHRETLRVKDPQFEEYLRAEFYAATGRPAPTEAITTVIKTVAALAVRKGPYRPVFRRVGGDDAGTVVYLDLVQPDWSYVEITAAGWRVCRRPALSRQKDESETAFLLRDAPVRFTRSPNTLALPIPVLGVSLERFKPFLDATGNDDNYPLILGWLIGTLHPSGPYPGLGLLGPASSGKTTLLRITRRLVDPHRAMARPMPQSERELLIGATQSHVQSFDNLSGISDEMSDAMCRLMTGGGLATRTLYENDAETVFEAVRPIVFTSIFDIITRADLADRCVLALMPERRQKQADAVVETGFQKAWPGLLGGLLTAVAAGLRKLPDIPPLKDPTRMATFVTWIAACESGGGLPWTEVGTFEAAYKRNIAAAAEIVMEAEPVAGAIIDWVNTRAAADWTGTAKEALTEITKIAGHAAIIHKKWPRSPRGLISRLIFLTPILTRFGVQVTRGKLNQGRTSWSIDRKPPT